MLRRILLLLAIGAAPVAAQQSATPALLSNVQYARRAWTAVRTNLLQSAEMMPDSLFNFAPTAEVRSFGEILEHVAANEGAVCQMALGEEPTGAESEPGVKTKAGVLTMFKASLVACTRAYAQSDASAARRPYEGGPPSRLQLLFRTVMHENEHYGNIVTYLRLNHLVPPSGQP